jgi:hypothetical protein
MENDIGILDDVSYQRVIPNIADDKPALRVGSKMA